MAMRRKIRRRVQARRPTVRRLPSSSTMAARTDAKRNTLGDSGLLIGGIQDPAEKAADQMADRVMRMPISGGMVHRKCKECKVEENKVKRAPENQEQEETVKTKSTPTSSPIAAGSAAVTASPNTATAIKSMGVGKPLAQAERAFFEPRFGTDLSSIRIHDDSTTDKASQGIHARAFTLGSNIAFAKGEHRPETESGRHLMAHELAHVVNDQSTLRRAVRSNSSCADNSNNSPGNALQAIEKADSMGVSMASAADGLLLISTTTMTPNTFHTDNIVKAYFKWFGGPRQLNNGRFKSRFRRASFPSVQEAASNEMRGIGGRLTRIARWLQRAIRYQCPGTSRFTLRGCRRTRCDATDLAIACPTGTRHIAICPHFWDFPDVKAQASVLVHEAAHAGLRFGGHPERLSRRHRNPACYGKFLREVFGVSSINTQCDTTTQVPPAPTPTPTTGGNVGP